MNTPSVLPDIPKENPPKRVCIVGYGSEGASAERYLKHLYPGIEIGILDASNDPDYLLKQKDYDMAIRSPGVEKEKITIPYTTTTNIFFSNIKNKTIGITGTKGKSTTSKLIHEMLVAGDKKARLLGNIGNPVLDIFETGIEPEEIFVIELSSYMLDDTLFSPNVSVLLNISPAHTGYHGTRENYARAKENIFKYHKDRDLLIREPFTETIPLEDTDIPLMGEHNKNNIRAAIAAVRAFGVSDDAIKEAVKNFKSLPYRIENIGTFKDITFYNDAIATTPKATIAALNAIPNVDTLLIGGEEGDYEFEELEKTLRKKNVRNIVLFPDTGRRVLSSKEGFNLLETREMKEAVAFAYEHTKKGGACLLSTASPSFSVWKNYKEKGDLFTKYVQDMGQV